MSNTNFLKQVSDKETEIILELLKSSADILGDIVELGCYRGDTSLLMERLLESDANFKNKRLWLYDSFEGLPPKTSEDNSVAGDNFRAGELLVSKRDVVLRFKKAGLRIPRIRKGFFDTLDATSDFPDTISFAFLDGDLYKSILTSLQLIWPKLSAGATVIVHDYNNPELPGVSKAVDEWLLSHHAKLERRESLAILKS